MRTCVPILLFLVLVSPACGGGDEVGLSNPLRMPLTLELQDGDGCLTYIDGESAGDRVRTIKIRNDFKQRAGDDGGVVVRLTCPPGLTVSTPTAGWTISPDERVIEGEIKGGEELCVPLYFANIKPGQPPTKLLVELESFRLGSNPIPEASLPFEFHSRPSGTMNAALVMLAAAGLPVDELTTHDVEKPRYESSWKQAQRETEAATDIVAHTKTAATLDAAYLASLATAFPAGAGSTAYTVLAKTPAPGLPGDWLFLTLMFDDMIPPAAPFDEYQFVFGTKLDADDTNDYQAPPDFPGDTFRDTDLQHTLTFKPSLGWILTVTEYENGVLQEIASAAWVAVLENALMFAIPPGGFLPDAQPYFSAFRHDGTWGQLAPFDWSMDYVPLRGDEP